MKVQGFRGAFTVGAFGSHKLFYPNFCNCCCYVGLHGDSFEPLQRFCTFEADTLIRLYILELMCLYLCTLTCVIVNTCAYSCVGNSMRIYIYICMYVCIHMNIHVQSDDCMCKFYMFSIPGHAHELVGGFGALICSLVGDSPHRAQNY